MVAYLVLTAGAGRLPEDQGQPGLYIWFQASQGCIVKVFLKKTKRIVLIIIDVITLVL